MKLPFAFTKSEQYGPISQMRRASVSVSSNIVEGCARESQNEYVRFLEIAFGSLKELHYQLTLATRLGYVSDISSRDCDALLDETEKVLGGLIRSMRNAL